MQINNYTSSKSHWLWTGRYNLNQLWSYFYVREPMYVTSIDVFWGGYDSKTQGRHFIAKWGGNGQLTGLVVQSGLISVSQGRKWRTANVRKTLLEPGSYAVGLWGDRRTRRTVGMWNGDGSQIIYLNDKTSVDGTTSGQVWDGAWTGVVPARLNGESAGRISIKANGSWRDGQAWVKSGGTWRQAQGVWVKQNGIWRRNK